MVTKTKYIKEYLKWKDDMLGIKMGNLAKVKDEYYQMILTDVDYLNENGTELKMTVMFSEVKNPQFKGEGTFKYKHSDIPGFTEIIPIELRGILGDIFDEDSGVIYDFARQIYEQLQY